MARKTTGIPRGPKDKPIDWKHFEQLCHIQCLQSEISSFFQVSVDTIERRVKKQYGENYADVYKRFSDGGRSSVRRLQYRHAENNVAMCIWLGKQYLGQKDHQDPISNTSPKDEIILANQEILKLKYELMEAKNAIQRQADNKLQPSDSAV